MSSSIQGRGKSPEELHPLGPPLKQTAQCASDSGASPSANDFTCYFSKSMDSNLKWRRNLRPLWEETASIPLCPLPRDSDRRSQDPEPREPPPGQRGRAVSAGPVCDSGSPRQRPRRIPAGHHQSPERGLTLPSHYPEKRGHSHVVGWGQGQGSPRVRARRASLSEARPSTSIACPSQQRPRTMWLASLCREWVGWGQTLPPGLPGRLRQQVRGRGADLSAGPGEEGAAESPPHCYRWHACRPTPLVWGSRAWG